MSHVPSIILPGVRYLALAVLASALGIMSASAQSILLTPPTDPVVPQIVRDQLPPPPASVAPSPPETPYKLGPIVLHPRVSYSFMHTEGLPTRGRRVDGDIQTFSAGVSGDLTRHWTFDYGASWLYYSSPDLSDSFDQSFKLSGATSFQQSSLNFSQSYSVATPTLVETGTQTKQETWATQLGGTYAFTRSIQLHASGGLNERYTETAPDTRVWSGNTMLSWAATNRLSLSAGPSFSYNEIADSPDYYSESYMGQIQWSPVDKLSLDASFGKQYSHSTSSTGVDFSNPTLSVSGVYHPFDTTTISVTGSRTVSPSYFKAQANDNFRWLVAFDQRLLTHFYFSASYSSYKNDYVSLDTLNSSGRSDEVESITTRLSTRLFKRFSISITYQKFKNRSNDAAFSFSNQQYGFDLSYRY